jgi:hypothetical protein
MPFDEPKTLHQFLVKMCHPDVGPPQEKSIRTPRMKEINNAHAARDLPRLRRIATEVLGTFSSQSSSQRSRAHSRNSSSDEVQERAAKALQEAELIRRKAEALLATARQDAERIRKLAETRMAEAQKAQANADQRRAQAEAGWARAQEAIDRATGEDLGKKRRDSGGRRRLQFHSWSLLVAVVISATLGWSWSNWTGQAQDPSAALGAARPTATSANVSIRPTSAALQGGLEDTSAKQTPAAATTIRFGAMQSTSVKQVFVTTASGKGAYLRKSKTWEDKKDVLPEGQVLQVIAQVFDEEGRLWYYVSVPDSQLFGYIPTELTTTRE